MRSIQRNYEGTRDLTRARGIGEHDRWPVRGAIGRRRRGTCAVQVIHTNDVCLAPRSGIRRNSNGYEVVAATGSRCHIENKFGWEALAAPGIGLKAEGTSCGQLCTVDAGTGAIVEGIIIRAVTPNIDFSSGNSKQKSIDIERRIRGRSNHIVVKKAPEWAGGYPRPSRDERVRPHVAPPGHGKIAGSGQPCTTALIRHVQRTVPLNNNGE